MGDDEFIRQFESCTLPEASFRHPEHVRLAWLYLQRQPVLAALDKFSGGLRRFAAHAGKAGRYHETITWAYMLLLHERMRQPGASSLWSTFAEANADLLQWKPSILNRYYAPETLSSELAKTAFVFPDRFAEEPAGRTGAGER